MTYENLRYQLAAMLIIIYLFTKKWIIPTSKNIMTRLSIVVQKWNEGKHIQSDSEKIIFEKKAIERGIDLVIDFSRNE